MRRSRQGFSLIEVLLGALLFASVFSGLAASWHYQEKSLKQYRNRNAARYILQKEVERVLAKGFYNIEVGTAKNSFKLIRKLDGEKVEQIFEVETKVTQNSVKNLKYLSFTISFNENNETKKLNVRSSVFRG